LPTSLITALDSKEDKNKLEELYKKYRGLMLHIAIQILKNHELAEDVLSDSVIKIIRHRQKIFGLTCYQQRLYIVNIIKTTSFDLLKKMNNNPTEDIDGIMETMQDIDNTVFDEVIANEGYETIKRIIKTLPDGLKNVAYLNLICEYNHKEIAGILGISNSASKMRLARAKKALREALTGGENEK
jgi:RNA polymerase sigma-70 factor (ECF subfamily)